MRVGDLGEHRVDRALLDLAVVRLDAVDDLGVSFMRRAISAPMIACEPSTSCVTALPMSCRKAPRLAIAGSSPSSAAKRRRDVGAISTRCSQHVLAVARAVLEPTEQLDHLGVDVA